MTTNETESFNAMLGHHQQMCDEMGERVDDIVRAVEGGDDYRKEVAALVAYLGSDILPHALAEEKTIYRAAMVRSDLADTVRSMIDEHEVLIATGEQLARASTGPSALVYATRLVGLFRLHVRRENDGLLPILLEDPGVDLNDQLKEMQRLISTASDANDVTVTDLDAKLVSLLFDASKELKRVGQEEKACQVVAAAWAALRYPRPALAAKATAQLHALAKRSSGEPVPLRTKSEANSGYRELDVRHLAPAQRHVTIFAEFSALAPGAGFVLVNDHDPKPLYYQFEAEHAGAFSWETLESGPDVWRVAITKSLSDRAAVDALEASDRDVVELDVRVIAHAQRHDVIFATYHRLRSGESFVLVNDHDPKPLRYQFDAQYAGAFMWEYLETGPQTWRVRIERVAPVTSP